MIDPKKSYRTRDGREVRILMTDGGDWNYPVIAAYKDKDDRWWPLHLTADGRHSLNPEAPNCLDLIEVRPRIQREVWVNVYSGDMDMFFDCRSSKVEADLVGGNRIACVKVVIDCEEGDGL